MLYGDFKLYQVLKAKNTQIRIATFCGDYQNKKEVINMVSIVVDQC